MNYTYSPGGRLTALTDWANRTSNYTYQPSGLVATLTYPNAMVASFAYDRAQRLTGLTYTLGTVIAAERYTLDSEGNRVSLEDLFGATPRVAGTLRYDGLARLTSFERHLVASGAPVSNETFSLDPASNITTRTGPTATYTYDGANRLLADGTRSFVWDDADRLVARGTDTFGYDPLGRMTSSLVAGTARSYTYDGDGLLRSRTQGSETTSFLYDPSIAPAPLLVAGTERLVYGLGPLYRVHSNATYDTFVRDGLGSVRLEVSSNGRIINAYDYTAYGAVNAATSLPLLGFAGEFTDPSGLIYLRARWYDPEAGLFQSSDPLGGSMNLPVSLGRYLYGSRNPIRFVDPLGLDAQDARSETLAKALLEDAVSIAAGAAARRIPDAGVRWTFNGTYTSTWGVEEWIGPQAVRPLAKTALEGAHRVGVWAGAAQGITDLIFHPELSAGQRIGRVGVAAAVGVTAVAIAAIVVAPLALTGLAAAAATIGVATVVGIALDEVVVRPKIYPGLGLGR